MARMTQLELDALADILWWVKGYIWGCNYFDNDCVFDDFHVKALKKAKEVLQLKLNSEEGVVAL